eukprot:COSAG02_NODE_7201_length_3122_cov_3.639762_3_plen_183_part_00
MCPSSSRTCCGCDTAYLVTQVGLSSCRENDQAESGPAASSATGVTVEGYNPMLESRKEELSYTDTGNGWSMRNVIKPLPVDEVMAVLYNHYDAGATLTDEMITGIDWLYSDEANDFRRTATQEDNIPGQLLAVLNGTSVRRAYHLLADLGHPEQRGTAGIFLSAALARAVFTLPLCRPAKLN